METKNELSRAAMKASSDVIYTMDRRLCITYCNPAWDRFAAANGGERAMSKFVVGRQVFDFIPTPLLPFYEAVFRVGRVAQFDYECSSADTFRLYRMMILKQRDEGFAVVNSKRIERPHRAERLALHALAKCYDGDGVVVMCAHCRRSLRRDEPEAWDWVPELVSDATQRVRYELCPICKTYFFSQDARARSRWR